MKRIILICFLLFSFISAGYSQSVFGLKAGGNLVNLDNNVANPGFGKDHYNKVRVYAGISGEWHINQQILFRAELLYSGKGRAGVVNSLPPPINLNYLSLPVLLGHQLNSRFSVYIGPEISYLLSGYIYAGNNGPDRNRINIKDDPSLKAYDYGLGAGLSFKLSDSFHLEARYGYGLKTVTPQLGNQIGERNQALQFGINYRLKRGLYDGNQ